MDAATGVRDVADIVINMDGVCVEEPGLPGIGLQWDRPGRLVERRRGELAMRWSASRGSEPPHPLTQELMDAIVGVERRPK